jgi:hypothetical protein
MVHDNDFEEWVTSQRRRVEDYLGAQGIPNPNVGPWPAFEVAPKFAIWPVESKKIPGKIGWWAFSGDCPTDYVSEDGQCHPRAALRNLLEQWRNYVVLMKRGQQPPKASFGEDANLQDLGALLEKRVEILAEWVLEDDLWEER